MVTVAKHYCNNNSVFLWLYYRNSKRMRVLKINTHDNLFPCKHNLFVHTGIYDILVKSFNWWRGIALKHDKKLKSYKVSCLHFVSTSKHQLNILSIYHDFRNIHQIFHTTVRLVFVTGSLCDEDILFQNKTIHIWN